MAIEVVDVAREKFLDLLERGEGHFLEFKSTKVAPARLTRTLSAFSNADGGELYVGIEDADEPLPERWVGFSVAEDANAHIQAFEEFFPLGTYFRYDFLRCSGLPGFILHCEVAKTPDVRTASDRRAYLRRGAQNLAQDTEEKLTRLRLNKGITSYEDHIVNADVSEVTNSAAIIEFMLENIPDSEPDKFLHKQQLLVDARPTLAAVVLFADDPQAILPNTGIKIYQYQTSEEGT